MPMLDAGFAGIARAADSRAGRSRPGLYLGHFPDVGPDLVGMAPDGKARAACSGFVTC